MDALDTSKITCGIKTFERPDSVNRLLASIYRKYPDIRCVVVDDSREPAIKAEDWPNVKHIRLDFDTGLGAGRNAMIEAVDTEYCLYLDDDHTFVKETRLDVMQAALDKNLCDLIGGQFREKGKHMRLYHGLLQIKGDTLTYVRDQHRWEQFVWDGEPWFLYHVDIVNNFFMARTDWLKRIQWDAELKINTHTEFFLRASRTRMRIAFCPALHIYHHGDRPSKEYSQFRHRKYRPAALAKHGVQRCQYQGRWK